jgi:2',3'-cyclic-nucleotide 2'-phosphodiesterase (5'-nucleotidase family)
MHTTPPDLLVADRAAHCPRPDWSCQGTRALLAAALIAAIPVLFSTVRGQAPAASTLVLSIVGTNDLHGGVVARDGVGGLALLGGYIKNLRAARQRDGGAVLVIDGGDMFQGTLESNLSEGTPVVAAYNAIGYTAAAIGNHEFDFGPVGPATTPAGASDDPRGALKARAAEARFPFLAANLIDDGTGRPVEWPNVKPAVIVEAAGLRVAIIGVMTKEALSATIAGNVKGLRVAPLAETIVERARQLRAEGASIVVVAAHAGGRCTALTQPSNVASCDPAGEILAVARAIPRGLVDAVVAGHTHAGMAHVVEGIGIIEAFSGGRAFGRIDLVIDRATSKIVEQRLFAPRNLCAAEDETSACDTASPPGPTAKPAQYEGQPVVPDPAVVAVLAPTLDTIASIKARPIGVTLAAPIRRAGTVESPLGNLFTDALRAGVPGADASLHNTTGGLRADLPSGPLVYGSVYEVMPFENKVIALRLTGAQLKRVFASHLAATRRTLGISGIRVRAGCSGSAVDVSLTRLSGVPVRDDEWLSIAVSDFLATGGDGILKPVLPEHGVNLPTDAPLARDLLAEYLRQRGDGLTEARLVDIENPRVAASAPLPLACR